MAHTSCTHCHNHQPWVTRPVGSKAKRRSYYCATCRKVRAWRAKARGWQKQRRDLYPEKHRATAAVAKAKKDGTLVPLPCERCGVVNPVVAHHDDYSRPFDVRWLCNRHHIQRHRELGWGVPGTHRTRRAASRALRDRGVTAPER